MSLNILTLNSFNKDVKRLYKKYRQLPKDLQTLKTELSSNPTSGIDLGNHLYKIRLANSSIPTGKSAGFRVVYYFYNHEEIYLLTLFSKHDLENIEHKKLLILLENNINN